MHRTKLARTLLVLGVTAMPGCEHADEVTRRPLIDRHARPAVGNIGQTGRPDPAPPRPALAAPAPTPLPVVAMRLPTPKPRPRRVLTVPAAPAALPAPASPPLELQSAPLVNELERPAVGNIPRSIPRKCGDCGEDVETSPRQRLVRRLTDYERYRDHVAERAATARTDGERAVLAADQQRIERMIADTRDKLAAMAPE